MIFGENICYLCYCSIIIVLRFSGSMAVIFTGQTCPPTSQSFWKVTDTTLKWTLRNGDVDTYSP